MVIIEVSQIVADCVLTEIPGWIFLAPFNVLSVNVQSGYLLEPYSKSIWCALKYIYQTEGIAGLYKGNLYSIIHSIARRLCSVPLELSLLVIRQAILRRFTISLPIKKLITTFIFIFGFEQGYTYPVKYIRNSVMISGGSGFSKLLNILRTDGFIGLYTGIEGTYIGLIPGVFLCIYLQNILFPASKYHELVDTVELMESDDESEEDEEEDIFADIEGEPENNDEFENIEENDDGENGNANVDENDNENDIEDDVDELINELDDSERILARSEEAISKMNIRDWKVMLKLGMRVYVTKVLSTLSLKVRVDSLSILFVSNFIF